MLKIKLQIITPEKVVFSEEVDQFSVTTEAGEITVLPHHIPLVTTLKAGELRYKKDGQEDVLAISGGFAEVRPNNEVVVLADSADYAHEIDIAKAEEAKNKALKLLQTEHDKDDTEYASIQGVMERELNRIRVGNKYRKLPPSV
jgi:F-type H+-transporting ATPase subunit epsilon